MLIYRLQQIEHLVDLHITFHTDIQNPKVLYYSVRGQLGFGLGWRRREVSPGLGWRRREVSPGLGWRRREITNRLEEELKLKWKACQYMDKVIQPYQKSRAALQWSPSLLLN